MTARSSPGRRPRAVIFLATVSIGALTWWPVPALAHVELERSRPSGGARLARPPDQVRLEFSQEVQSAFAVVVVTPASGLRVEIRRPLVDGDTVTARLPTFSAAGRYRVAWRVVAVDGHPLTGHLHFTVRRSPRPSATSPPPSITPPEAPSPGVPGVGPAGGPQAPWWRGPLLPVSGAVALAVAGALLLRQPRRRP